MVPLIYVHLFTFKRLFQFSVGTIVHNERKGEGGRVGWLLVHQRREEGERG